MQTGNLVNLKDEKVEPKKPLSLEELTLRAKNELIKQEEMQIADKLVNTLRNEANTKYLHEVLLPESKEELTQLEKELETLTTELVKVSESKTKEDREKKKELRKEKEVIEEKIKELREKMEKADENMRIASKNAEENKRKAEFILSELSK